MIYITFSFKHLISEANSMDMESNFTGDDWESLMEGYLKKFGDNEQIDSEISSLFFRLSETLEKKSLMFWHVKSFRDYIRDNITPLGLWVQIFPTLDDLDTDLKQR